jgi:hypothetical protein
MNLKRKIHPLLFWASLGIVAWLLLLIARIYYPDLPIYQKVADQICEWRGYDYATRGFPSRCEEHYDIFFPLPF